MALSRGRWNLLFKSLNFNARCHANLSYFAGQVNPVCELAKNYSDRIAIKDSTGEHSYDSLLTRSEQLARVIVSTLNVNNKSQTRIATLLGNDADYVVAQWATWKSGNISVPLHPKYPAKMLKYYMEDSQSPLIITNEELAEKSEVLVQSDVSLKRIVIKDDLYREAETLPTTQHLNKHLSPSSSALILYTSGTTGPPKGVVMTQGNLSSNVTCMVDAWKWNKSDVILHTLPLHHTHGLVNALLCPLAVGACVIMQPKFDAEEVWIALLSNDSSDKRVNVFMAVPTMYSKLVEEYEKKYADSPRTKAFIKAACKQNIRLMVSGSAALPEPVFEKWHEITGHELLERYGMTEIGMALTNPLKGPRKPGYVGNPFPTTRVCITKPNSYSSAGYDILAEGDHRMTRMIAKTDIEGELWVKGPNVFKEYWNKPDATKQTFSKDGWFKTGDTATFIDGSYKILGRSSVDIIKSGGYKISALDIERHLSVHPSIMDCVVVGLPDQIWGQKIATVVALKENRTLELPALKEWLKERIPSHSTPTVLKIVEQLPRNAMGKVNKKEIIANLFPEEVKRG